MLIPSAAASAEFFHTAAGTAFVDLLINGNRETWPIRSKRFRTWLRRRHYEVTRTAASTAAINSALDLLEAQAQFEGPEREVRVRLAEHAGYIQAARPILLNGIDDVIGRSDLADRALFLTLPLIADRRRRVESQLWREFEVARPRILGSLFDAAAHGLRNVAGIHLDELPRMADLALWAYQANRRAAIEDLIDADPVAAWVRQIMANRSTWTGSASDLLRAGAALATRNLRPADISCLLQQR
jgi:hypothetical protein